MEIIVKKMFAAMMLAVSLGSMLSRCVLVPGSRRMPARQETASPPRVERPSADELFPIGRGDVSDIRPSDLRNITQIAAQLPASQFGHVKVLSYTDRLGSDSYNLALSQRRANSVREVLVQQGVPAEIVLAEELSSRDPVAQCGNKSADTLVRCLQPNRRVEIVTYVRDDPRRRQ